jgi:hypothetical protein
MEPGGIEPPTSCLQSSDEEGAKEPGSPGNPGEAAESAGSTGATIPKRIRHRPVPDETEPSATVSGSLLLYGRAALFAYWGCVSLPL